MGYTDILQHKKLSAESFPLLLQTFARIKPQQHPHRNPITLKKSITYFFHSQPSLS
jgi:hypothetical protein